MCVVCLSNRGDAELLVTERLHGRLEGPVTASDAMLRVVDESGEDYLFPAKRFTEVALRTDRGAGGHRAVELATPH